MKTRHLIVGFLLFHTSVSFAQDRGMKPVQVTIEGSTTTLYAQSHALLIGVSGYNAGLPPLPLVVGDITAVRSALEANGFNVTTVMNPDNTGLQRAFTGFIAKYGQSASNRLLIYFAGHGYTEKMPYGDDIGYICPVDTPDPNKNPAGFQEKAMPMRQIETYAYQIKSKHALFLFDACFSGSVFSTSRAIPEVISYKTKEPVRQFITSGSANETVPDKSIFKDQFIRALNGEADGNKDGFLTGTELGEFLQSTVVNYSYGSQHPQYGKIRNPNLDKGDFIFVLNKTATPPGPSVSPTIVEERTLVQYGKLDLTTEIAGALYLDGTYMKQVNANTALTLNNLTEGTHTIKVVGDETVEKTVTIYSSQTSSVTIDKKRVETASWVPEMVFVQGGTFQMGSNENDDEKPVHSVAVSGLYIGKYEVTVSQFQRFISETGYQTDADKDGGSYVWTGRVWEKRSGVNWKCDAEGNIRPQSEYNHPVIHVSWNDATEYCTWLNRKTGKSFRLPTEAEWEYAAGNGSKHTKYSWGSGDPYGKNGGNVADESGKRKFSDWTIFSGYDDGYVFTAPVGSYNPNDFGLYDMTGNVWEWCSDWYQRNYYSSSPSSNPKGPLSGSYRVLRGGGWNYGAQYWRSSDRDGSIPGNRSSNLGFRLVLVP